MEFADVCGGSSILETNHETNRKRSHVNFLLLSCSKIIRNSDVECWFGIFSAVSTAVNMQEDGAEIKFGQTRSTRSMHR